MGGHGGLTQQVDVYAFAITCVELLTKRLEQATVADGGRRRCSLLRSPYVHSLVSILDVALTSLQSSDDNMRPELPLLRVWSQHLSEILRMCWDRNPSMRPTFAEVDKQVQQLRARYGADLKESPAPRRSELERMKTKKSPDMHPIPLPLLPRECIQQLPLVLTSHYRLAQPTQRLRSSR